MKIACSFSTLGKSLTELFYSLFFYFILFSFFRKQKTSMFAIDPIIKEQFAAAVGIYVFASPSSYINAIL